MMWQTVTIQQPTTVIGASGGRTATWAAVSGLSDVPARVFPVANEDPDPELTVMEDTYQVHLAGAFPQVVPAMRVLDGAAAYDIRRVAPPSPWTHPPVTVLDAVKVAV